MAQASFSAPGITPLVFSVNPRYPGKLSFCSGALKALTEGGEEYVYEKGDPCVLTELRFEGMPASDYDGGFDYAAGSQEAGTQSLVNWFMAFCASGGRFTYTDPFGKAHAVSLCDDRLDFQLTDYGLYDGAVRLKERVGPSA